MAYTLTILGANSAIPTAYRYPTAQLLDIYQSFYLIDCGEGTQMQLRRNRIKMQRIGCIFISHMHGDHYFGLFGLLNTMHLLGRKRPLKLFGPPDLWHLVQQTLDQADAHFNYEVIWTPLSHGKSQVIHEDQFVKVSTIPLDHRIATNGFLFEETPKKRKLKKELLRELDIPVNQLSAIKDGEDYIDEDGAVFPNARLTTDPQPARSYAFCSDTRYNERIVPFIKNVDLLYHEATFVNDMKGRASATYHSTAEEAATIAKKANVKKLLLGHYSARYKHLDQHLVEAKAVFNNSHLAMEGKRIEVE